MRRREPARFFQILLWYFFHPKEIVQRIDSVQAILLGAAIGVLGAFSFPVLSYLTRVGSPDNVESGTHNALWVSLALVAGFFLGASVLVYLCAFLFGGRGSLLRFIGTTGWSGLFFVIMSIGLSLTMFLAPRLDGMSGATHYLALGATVVPVLLSLALFVAWFRLVLTGLREVLGLGRWRSIVLWVVLLLPLLLVYDSLV
jgi:hypothetical protein